MGRSAETTRDDPDGEYLKRNRWFESGSLQQRVTSELACHVGIGLPPDADRLRADGSVTVIGVDNMMWGSGYPHSESTFPQSRKILAEILAGYWTVP